MDTKTILIKLENVLVEELSFVADRLQSKPKANDGFGKESRRYRWIIVTNTGQRHVRQNGAE